ncbi:uracil-DNA glycosylase family protein [Sulfurovum sp. NBC37-1]|uniref:uracil-DNA glycosylase family protein n=1 Tax=Sulfurovum sp. (strain NBC37-1) TaxID=387093 RepID=UPI0001587CF1|nr:uracil-DNA glycosylase family protein [Sulfurovum sp. NBC37-1]BAF73153.1 uracil-DNA glycosylase [Sulfurovum sp. NBC37-1]
MPSNSWEKILQEAYGELEEAYRSFLEKDSGYIPNRENYLNAFKTLPREKVKYILFGQDPYPRMESASGYAFIDAKVKEIFSDKGLSKEVNRATSLRNFVKMALVARGDLSLEDLSQDAIAAIDKTSLISSIRELRINFEKNGVLLLNTALVFTDKKSSTRHVKAWRPFVQSLLKALEAQQPKLILFGTHAKELKKKLPLENFESIELEHPYNHTFISNPRALALFGPMHLLDK